MSTACDYPETDTDIARQLQQTHYRWIGSGRYEIPLENYAVTFRPGDRTGHFLGKRFRPLGTAVMVVLKPELSNSNYGPRLKLIGYRRGTESGWDDYGTGNPIFHFAGDLRPQIGARRQRLDPERNPSLVILLVRMFRALHHSRRRYNVSTEPVTPKVWCGFHKNSLPEYRRTPGLDELAAKRLERPIDRLNDLGEDVLARYLKILWYEQWLMPDHPENRTGIALIDRELCASPQNVLREYEDFGPLIGSVYPNPADGVKILERDNPAASVLAKTTGFEQGSTTSELNLQITMMRESLQQDEEHFHDDDLKWALENPDQPLRACHQALPLIRRILPDSWSECSSDEDLLLAARFPEERLWVSGAAKVQIIRE